MEMNRHPEHSDVLQNRHEFRGVEHFVVDIGKDLKTLETEFLDAAIHLRYGLPTISKADAAEANELPWITVYDSCQVVVDPLGPVICLRSAKHIGAERKSMTQDRDIDFHIFHVSQLLLDVDHLWERGYVEADGALDTVGTAVENTLGQITSALQMLDKVQALKVCVDIDAHYVPLCSRSNLLGRRIRARRPALLWDAVTLISASVRWLLSTIFFTVPRRFSNSSLDSMAKNRSFIWGNSGKSDPKAVQPFSPTTNRETRRSS